MGVHPVHAALTTPYVQTLIRCKARRIVQRLGLSRSDESDVAQDLRACVLKQAHQFDPALAGVNTFIARVVDSGAAMIVRDRRRLKRAAGLRLQSLEGSTLQHEGEEKTLADVLVDDDLQRRHGTWGTPDEERHDVSADTARVLAHLKPPLRAIARRLMKDDNEVSIARDLGISRRQVRKAIADLGRHFKRASLE
jgi:DNA-directed RNA polymerase specialized sigma24 family protein